jgi:hypothetical protein
LFPFVASFFPDCTTARSDPGPRAVAGRANGVRALPALEPRAPSIIAEVKNIASKIVSKIA